MDRMVKARQSQMEKKLMTERGVPSQLIANLGQPEKTMNFTQNTNKFKSAFGVDGSQILPPKRANRRGLDQSSRMDRSQLSSANLGVRAQVQQPARLKQQPPVQQQRPQQQQQQP